MIILNKKEYLTIIWDWRSTLYDPNTEKLYPWVEDFLNTKKVNNILVSWAFNPQRRIELVNSFPISKKFSEIFISSVKKKETFEKIFDLENVDPETTLIVGDNVNDELAIAKELGVDSIHVDNFVKELKLAK